MSSSARIVRLVSLAGIAAMGVASQADATVRNWLNAAGGAASTASTWSPAGQPVAGDFLTFGLAGSYAVIFDAASANVAADNFGACTVSISATSPHTVTSQFATGNGGAGNVNITGGSFSVAGTISV